MSEPREQRATSSDSSLSDAEIRAIGRRVLKEEADALSGVGDRVGDSFTEAVQLLHACRGRALVTGLGKSGLIARKIAATLTSTGTPALFVHPVEALHGDLGIATRDDVVLAISRSGDNEELLVLVSSLKALGLKVIVITGALESRLAQTGDVILDVQVPKEACPLDLTPTTSATAALVMADALTVALLRVRDFRREDFAVFHPSGVLGRSLLLRVRDLMHGGDELPVIAESASLRDAVLVIAEKRLGCACVVDGQGLLVGFLSDGDLKRIVLDSPGEEQTVWARPVGEVMTRSPRTIDGEALAKSALHTMETNSGGPITQLIVVHEGRPEGILHLHDILRHGLSRRPGTNLA